MSSRFRESALIPYTLEGGIYALPETQTFQVMFYRTDILEELGIQIPANWEEFFTAVGKLQRNNMTAGIQPPNSAAGNFLALSSMAMLLYQHGGELYIDGNTRSGLGSEAAEKAFSTWVSMYADYDLPTKYDPLTRFRSGEMPIVVEDFTFYNLLSVAAPEIRGTLVLCPGSRYHPGKWRDRPQRIQHWNLLHDAVRLRRQGGGVDLYEMVDRCAQPSGTTAEKWKTDWGCPPDIPQRMWRPSPRCLGPPLS